MKLITAVIQPSKVDEVRDALKAAGVQGVTVSEVQGVGRQGGVTEVYRGAEYKTPFLPKVKVEVLAAAADAPAIVAAIAAAAQTGRIGDGKIWTIDVDGILRIRTGEADDEAL